MKKKYLLIFIVLLGFFLRFCLLGSVPAGLTSDEANTGYDAYSLLITGKDQWGVSYPLVSFKGFGDFRSPVYTYLVIPFVSIFSLSELAVRLPSAIAGVISIILIYLLAHKIFDKKTAVVAAFLLSTSPWGIGLSRQGIESNVAMSFFLLATYYFLKIKDNKKYLFFSIILYLITVYTYTSYIIFTSLTLFILSLKYHKVLFRVKKSSLVIYSIFLIGVLPIFFFSSAGNTRFSQIGFTNNIASQGIINVLNFQIGSCNELLPQPLCRLFNNKVITFASVFFQNYTHHFSFDFLYLKGATTQFSILPERGLLYMYEVVFFMIGLFVIAKRKSNFYVVLLLLASALPDAITGDGHHSRASTMLPIILIIESVGLVRLYDYLSIIKNSYIQNLFKFFIALLIVFSVTAFSITYFGYFRKHYSSYSLFAYKELTKTIYKLKPKYSHIYVSTYLNDAPQYIFYLFYNRYDPRKFQLRKSDSFEVTYNGFIKVKKLENITFGNFDFNIKVPKDNGSAKTLYIGSPNSFPSLVRGVAEFKDLSGGTIFKAVEYNELINHKAQANE